LKRRAAAEGIAHHVRLPQTKLRQNHAEIATDVDEIDLACSELRATVAMQMDADDLCGSQPAS
jgi:hypothetical protein